MPQHSRLLWAIPALLGASAAGCIVAGPLGGTATVMMARSTITISPFVGKSTGLPNFAHVGRQNEGIFGAPRTLEHTQSSHNELGGESGGWEGRKMVLQRGDASDSILSGVLNHTKHPSTLTTFSDQNSQQQSTKLAHQRHKSQISGPSEPSALDTRSFCSPHPLSQELGQQEGSSTNKKSIRHAGDDGRLARHPREIEVNPRRRYAVALRAVYA